MDSSLPTGRVGALSLGHEAGNRQSAEPRSPLGRAIWSGRSGRPLVSRLWKRRRSWGAAGGCAAVPRASSWPPRTRPRARTGRGSRAGCRSPISRMRSRSSRAATSRGEDARALLRGLLELHAIPGDEFPWDPVARRRLQLARGRARAARRPLRRGLAERGPAAPRGVPGRPPADGARRRPRAARRARRPGGRARAPRARDADGARDRLHLPAAGAADDRRPPAARLRLSRRCATPTARAASHAALGASVAGAGRQRRLALGARPRRGSPSCSAATALIEHAKDAAWQADVYLELLSTLAIAATHQTPARPGLRDLREPGVRARRARRRAQPRERAHAAEEEPVRARRDPHAGRPGCRRPRRARSSRCTPARRAPTTSTC